MPVKGVRSHILAVAFATCFAAPAFADPVPDFATLLRQARTAPRVAAGEAANGSLTPAR